MRNSHSVRAILLLMIVIPVAVVLVPGRAAADRRYFLESYTPWLAPAGESELETWLTSKSGRQDPDEGTTWEPRLEYEAAITHRLTGAAYLNFSRAPGKAVHLDSPSVEFIYQLADPGRLPVDPALYLEATENGSEFELEPRILLARRFGRVVSALNLTSEFEFRHNNEELLEDGSILHNEFKGEVSAGIAWDVAPRFAVALESRYRTEIPNFGPHSASVFSLGPSANFQTGKVQIALGVLPQLAGSPDTNGGRNLVDFEKTQVRAVIGIDL